MLQLKFGSCIAEVKEMLRYQTHPFMNVIGKAKCQN